MYRRVAAALVVAILGVSGRTEAAPLVFAATGSTPAGIQNTVDAFRVALGSFNGNGVGPFTSGRREINWDGVPDNLADPNNLPADLFNQNVLGRARGVVLSTPGSALRVSANLGNPTSTLELFGNLNATGVLNFQVFSPQRLFAAIDSTITDVLFFDPGSTTPALTRGFGAVFVDVEIPGATTIQFFNSGGTSLGTFDVPAGGNQGLSFLGVDFTDSIISRVRITSGNCVLTAPCLGDTGLTATQDMVVMDDFIYGEPLVAAAAVPVPAALVVFGTALVGLAATRRLRSR